MEDGVTSSYKPELATLKRMFEDARDQTYDARKDALIDQDYYDGYQWTAEERATLRKRLQPDLVFNRVRPAINGTLGVIKQGATDPRAYPRNPQDEESSDVASKTLRFIADTNRFDDLKLKGAKQYLVPGTCAAIIEVDEDRQVKIEPIRFEEFFYDPRSRREDFKDARYMCVAKWQYADEVAKLYPDAKKDVMDALEAGAPITTDETFDDRPKDQITWVDKKKRRVLTVELYHEDGGWKRCVFFAGGVLEAAESAYKDSKGRPTNPIEAQSCFVDRENNRYGLVRDMRGPQDEINKRRSKLLHELNNRQVRQVEMGAEMDAANVRQEAGRPDGILPYGWDFVSRADIVAGQAQLLAEAKAEIERMGPNPAILGRQGEDQSGRANLIRQQAGLTEQAIIFGGIEDWELRIYRQCWDRARQFWREPMWIRVTDDEGAPEFVQLNEPEMGPPQMVMGENGVPTIQPTVLGYKNAIAELDVDIILDTVPDTANVQQEQFQMLTELAKMYGPEQVPFEDVLEASSMPNKRQIIERRKARAEEAQQQQQQPNPMQELQMRGAVAEVSKTEAEAALTGAKAQNEMMRPQMEAAERLQQMHRPAAGV